MCHADLQGKISLRLWQRRKADHESADPSVPFNLAFWECEHLLRWRGDPWELSDGRDVQVCQGGWRLRGAAGRFVEGSATIRYQVHRSIVLGM